MKKSFVSVADFSEKEIKDIFHLTSSLKGKGEFLPLSGKTIVMIFQKPSTRTRVSFAVGIHQLGGHELLLSGQELQLQRGETVADTARTLSRYVDGIIMRANKHRDIVELAKYSTVPVINGLSDLEHPCQILSDVNTIVEKKCMTQNNQFQINKLTKLKLVYIGDGNNIANSWLLASAILGMKLTVCTPSGYEPNKEIFNQSKKIAKTTNAVIELSNDLVESVKNSDIIYTDVWTSMGKEKEQKKRNSVFRPYQVNKKLVCKANKDCLIMHCLPAHRGEEITGEVIDGPQSIVFDQAENRLHVQKAILLHLMQR